jgi:hypothetical protein
MRRLIQFVAVMLVCSAVCAADATDRSGLREISPNRMIAASRALRTYLTESQSERSKEFSNALAIVSLTEELITLRWNQVHEKEVKSRDAVLAEVEHLEKRVDELLLHVSVDTGRLKRDRVKELKTEIDAAVGDFRLRLKTAFFQ